MKPVTTNVSENSKLVLAIHVFVSKGKANRNVEYSFRRNLKLVDLFLFLYEQISTELTKFYLKG